MPDVECTWIVSMQCETLLKNETAKFQEVYDKLCKEKAGHLQAMKGTYNLLPSSKHILIPWPVCIWNFDRFLSLYLILLKFNHVLRNWILNGDLKFLPPVKLVLCMLENSFISWYQSLLMPTVGSHGKLCSITKHSEGEKRGTIH